jgi:hypothetical protein
MILDHHRAADLPMLRCIRPAQLHVEPPAGEAGLPVRLLRMLADSVGRTVTNFSIHGLHHMGASLLELQEAFSVFDEQGSSRITELSLSSRIPLAPTLSAVTCLRGLVSLRLFLTSEMIPQWHLNDHVNLEYAGLHLSALSSLPNLRELAIQAADEKVHTLSGMTMNDVTKGFLLGCSALPQLRSLDSFLLDDSAEGHPRRALAMMLRRLVHLEELSTLCNPSAQLWTQVHAQGGNVHLRNLTVNYYKPQSDDLSSFVLACNQDFPALTKLELHLEKMGTIDVARELAGLKAHPTLDVIKCGWFDNRERVDFFSTCQDLLGTDIK